MIRDICQLTFVYSDAMYIADLKENNILISEVEKLLKEDVIKSQKIYHIPEIQINSNCFSHFKNDERDVSETELCRLIFDLAYADNNELYSKHAELIIDRAKLINCADETVEGDYIIIRDCDLCLPGYNNRITIKS